MGYLIRQKTLIFRMTKKTKTIKKFNFALVSKTFLLLGALFLLIVMVYFLYNKFTRPQSISEILPADTTLGYLELNIDTSTSQLEELNTIFSKYTAYKPDTLKKQLESALQISLETDIQPWIGRRVSMAVMTEKNGSYIRYLPVGFIEVTDKEATLEFLRNQSLKQEDELKEHFYQKTPYFQFPSSYNLNFTFINNYLVFSNYDSAIKSLIDAQFNSSKKIIATQEFHKIRNNTPQTNIAFAYVNVKHTLQALSRNPSLLRSKTRELQNFSPYINLFNSIGFAVVADEPNLRIQQFAYLDKDKFPEQQFISTEQQFSRDLAPFIEKNIALYAGGQNMTDQIKNTFEILKANTSTGSIVFEGVLYNEVARFFGSEISLEQHIYPLLRGEYAFVIGVSENKPDIKLLLELTEPEKDISRFNSALENFRKVSALFTPKVVERELPDGTIAQEIVANEDAIVSETDNYAGQTINSLQMGEQPWGVHYSIIETEEKTIAVIASQKESIIATIDTLEAESENFTDSELFSKIARRQLPHAQEAIMANLHFLGLNSDDLEGTMLGAYLEPFNKFVMTKNYFDDGISTIYTFKTE